MNVRTSKDELAHTTAVTPLTRRQRLDIAIDAIGDSQVIYRTIRNIEEMVVEEVRGLPVAGTVFEPIVTALNAHGVATPQTVGGVMDSLELDQDHVHEIACACHENSEHMSSIHTGGMLAIIRDNVSAV